MGGGDSNLEIASNEQKSTSLSSDISVASGQTGANVASDNTNNNPEVKELQQALLDGADLTDLDATAAGGSGVGGGVSLGAANFDSGGHEANVSASVRDLADVNNSQAVATAPLSGYNRIDVDTQLNTPTIEAVKNENTNLTDIDSDGKLDSRTDKPSIVVSNIDSDVARDNEHIKLIDKNGKEIPATVTQQGDKVVLTPTTPLPQGDNELSVKVIDRVGNERTSAKTTIDVDTQLNTPTIEAVKNENTNLTDIDSDGKLDSRTDKPSIVVSNIDSDVARDNEHIKLIDKNGKEIPATVTQQGDKVVLTPTTPLPQGDNELSVKVIDRVGNERTSAKTTIDVDTRVNIDLGATTVSLSETEANNRHKSEALGGFDKSDDVKFDANQTTNLTSGGKAITIELSDDKKTATGYITDNKGAKETVFAAKITSENKYDVTLEKPIDQPADSDTSNITLAVTSINDTGTKTANISIDIADGEPSVTLGETSKSDNSYTGSITVDYGFDGKNSDDKKALSWDESGIKIGSDDPASFTSKLSDDGKTLTVTKDGGETLFKAILDSNSNSYTVSEVDASLAGKSISIGVIATDGDGDKAKVNNGTLPTISIDIPETPKVPEIPNMQSKYILDIQESISRNETSGYYDVSGTFHGKAGQYYRTSGINNKDLHNNDYLKGKAYSYDASGKNDPLELRGWTTAADSSKHLTDEFGIYGLNHGIQNGGNNYLSTTNSGKYQESLKELIKKTSDGSAINYQTGEVDHKTNPNYNGSSWDNTFVATMDGYVYLVKGSYKFGASVAGGFAMQLSKASVSSKAYDANDKITAIKINSTDNANTLKTEESKDVVNIKEDGIYKIETTFINKYNNSVQNASFKVTYKYSADGSNIDTATSKEFGNTVDTSGSNFQIGLIHPNTFGDESNMIGKIGAQRVGVLYIGDAGEAFTKHFSISAKNIVDGESMPDGSKIGIKLNGQSEYKEYTVKDGKIEFDFKEGSSLNKSEFDIKFTDANSQEITYHYIKTHDASIDKQIQGTEANDYIDAAKGTTVINAGGGDDIIIHNDAKTAIDGGVGDDTLVETSSVIGNNGSFNIHSVKVENGTSASETIDLSAKLNNIETIKLPDDGKQTSINISAKDILDITDSSNELKILGEKGRDKISTNSEVKSDNGGEGAKEYSLADSGTETSAILQTNLDELSKNNI